MMFYHVILNYTISNYIKSHYITSYHIKLYHIISDFTKCVCIYIYTYVGLELSKTIIDSLCFSTSEQAQSCFLGARRMTQKYPEVAELHVCECYSRDTLQ